MTLYLVITGVLLFYYLFYIKIFKNGLSRKYFNANIEKSFVSVVVAARNEQDNLPHLLTSLINQDYPDENYEIIIADDSSVDESAEIVKKFQKRTRNLRLIKVPSPDPNISRKKNALSHAVKNSKGKIILSTDADCMPKLTWISGMVRYFDKGVGMVCGLSLPNVSTGQKYNFVEKYELIDTITLFVAAAGALGRGKIFSGSGQNLAYRRKAFDKVDGYQKIMQYESGDDVLLMQLLRKAGYKIRFAFGKKTFIQTKSEKNLLNFLNQRIRWASNETPQLFMNREFFFYLLDVFFLNITILVGIIFYPIFGLAALLIKAFAEYSIIQQGIKRFQLNKNMKKLFPLWAILQPLYIFIVGLAGKLKLYEWKK
ncbi:MAG: glycosyltransferase [Candidatus Cloacimonetes bacterium]|nr:glycosyltransferase [Candidatus Cloacimonadota bacterium]